MHEDIRHKGKRKARALQVMLVGQPQEGRKRLEGEKLEGTICMHGVALKGA